ncbi:ribbon-helix-helix protein, CopG family [Candidatus Uhrbacteria bacterium]|nr:ribbon-helix-helix protein, CopG family [Candidatus Uhrbacteria bacterium]
MPNYNISLNDEIAQIVDTEIKERKYSSRSEFFRDLIRQRYVTDQDRCDIEVVAPIDPDAILIQKRKKDASFVSLNDLLRN